MSNTVERMADQLLARMQGLTSCVVAYSGGVDSAVVAKAAWMSLGDRALAVTGVSPSVPESELQFARSLAREIGIRHREIATQEFQQLAYTRNRSDRCFHCKFELYRQLQLFANDHGYAAVTNGANVDDQQDYRPGMQAANDFAIISPLVDCGLAKADVRSLAKYWGLTVWDKPATPCLSSRVAYGEEVTPQRLAMIHAVEQFLKSNGLETVRVRYHRGDLARVEVSCDALSRLAREPLRGQLVQVAKAAGFQFVTLDLEGFRSGSLNTLVQLHPHASGQNGLAAAPAPRATPVSDPAERHMTGKQVGRLPLRQDAPP